MNNVTAAPAATPQRPAVPIHGVSPCKPMSDYWAAACDETFGVWELR